MQDLRLTLLQQDLAWLDAPGNRARFAALLQSARGSHLALLPEMFNTGFTMQPQAWAETMDGPTVQWMREQAADLQLALGGTIAIREGAAYYNRFLFVRPDGAIEHYDKRHLFRMSGEHQAYSPGCLRRQLIWRGWRLSLQVCYDLRFPVWCRNRGDYDALLYLANWPSRRRGHWCALLRARAIENQAWVVGVNRIGVDGNGLDYSGDTLVIDPWGEVVLDAGADAGIHCVSLSASTLADCRERFPVHLDADAFSLT
jgi:omega-amidase